MAFPRIEGYVVTEKIGSGSYSTVYKAYNKVGGKCMVAVKCVDKERVKRSGAAVDNLVSEIRLLRSLTHTHIVLMHDFTWDDRNIYIIMEYCSGGDLSKYIKRYGRLPERQVRYFLQQLASALKFLYEKGILHMDLKPHNLLLQKESSGRYILKVADFGFAVQCGAVGGVRGSPLYMAPEVLAGAATDRGDLWSIGVILYECLFGAAPYSSASLAELLDKIQKRAPIRIPPNSSISPECRDLLHSLLQHDPARRITYDQFFSHPYLDLEHMPSPENYEKAVRLIRRAVELDCCGDLVSALETYTSALLYLVPCVGHEPDTARRDTITRKTTRYMERAEEIKVYLKAAAGGRGGLCQPGVGDRGGLCQPGVGDRGGLCEPGVGDRSGLCQLEATVSDEGQEASEIICKQETPPPAPDTQKSQPSRDKQKEMENDKCRIT